MLIDEKTIAANGLADSFVPPFPERPARRRPLAKLIAAYRRNLISIFHAPDFRTRKVTMKVLGTTVHVCNHAKGVRATLTGQHDTFERKTPQQRHALAPLLGDGLFVSDGATWRERRAAVAPIVHGRNVGRFAPVMRQTAIEWRDDWAAQGEGTTIDVLTEMGELTAEIISRTVFGAALGREFTKDIVGGFASFQRRVDQLDILSVLGAPDWVPRPRDPRVALSCRRTHKVIDGIIERLAAGEGDGAAVINSLFAAKDRNGKPLSRKAIRNEAIVIFMAGHETTANTLAWAFYLISQSPRVEARLHAELDEVLGGRVPDADDVAKLPYTKAVIEETLRLYPPVPLLGRVAKADGELGGETVPKGASLVVAPWLLHRNADLWSLPDHFVPERFDPAIAPRPDKYAYIPFASGPRVCPGLTFAMVESVICMATLCQAFRLTLEPGHAVETECRLTLRPGRSLPMRLHRRA